MSQLRTRHHDGAPRRGGPRVAGSRERARRTLEAGAAARGVDLDERPDLDQRPDRDERPDPDVGATTTPERPRSRRLLGRQRPAGEPEAPDEGPQIAPSGRPFRGGWPLVVGLVLAVALVATVTTAGLLARSVREDRATDTARTRALAAARTEAQAFLSYDYRRLDQDFAAAKAGLTGRFASEYAATSEQVVRPTATQYKAVVKAEVISLGVVDASPDQVVVIAYVDQTTTSTRLAGPRVDANRVRMTLVPVQGRWKVGVVDAL